MSRGKSIIYTGLSLLLLLTSVRDTRAQSFSNFNPNDELFNREVKVIDEFIERFNADSTTNLNRLFAKETKGKNIPRSTMLISLLNLENKTFTDNNSTVMKFFKKVMDKNGPVFLQFTDSNWYAVASAVFLDNGKLKEIPLVLHIQGNEADGAQWMITGIGNAKPSKEPMPSITLKKPKGNAQQYISTSSYGTNFAELHYLLTDNMQCGYYFDPGVMASESGKQFVSGVKSGHLIFQYVKSISFHFYQVDGWIFTADQYMRKTFNSGWLISSLQKTTAAEKIAERKKLLNR
jgi:hypothetical protein